MHSWKNSEGVQTPRVARTVFVVILLSVSLSSPTVTDAPREDEQRPLSLQELQALKIDTIKADILKKLGMTEKSERNFSREGLPSALDDEYWHESVMKQNEKPNQTTKKVIFLGRNARLVPCSTASCLEVTFDEALVHQEITSIDIWIYKERLQAGPDFISIYRGRHVNQTLQVTTTDSSKRGWVVTRLDHASDSWLVTNGHGMKAVKFKLQMSCKNCRFSLHKKNLPFLSVAQLDVPKRRETRVTCSPVTSCCRFALYVDFAGIGWDFILSPKGFDAFYCLGSCTGRHATATEHDHIVKRLKPNAQACCAPQKYGPLKLLYYDKDLKNAYLKDIQDIVALECGCL